MSSLSTTPEPKRMPTINITLPETDKNVARKAVFAVVRQVMEITGIPQDTIVNYKGDSDGNMQYGSTFPTSEDKQTTKMASENMLAIEVVENYTENGVATTAMARPENLPIFLDQYLDIILKPAYSSNEFEVNIKYRANSRTSAKRWRDDIRMKVSQMRDVHYHKLEYHYSVPREFLAILREIHRLRENVEGYGEDFETYFLTNSTTKMTEIANQSGTIVDYAIAESQVRVQGFFDFAVEPAEITKGPNAGQWESEFTYKFILDKPLSCVFQYPIMVHNQLLDEKYIPLPAPDTDPIDKSYTYSLSAISQFEGPNIAAKYYDAFAPIKIPEHDEFIPNVMPPEMMGIMSILCEIDPAQPKYYVDLHELGEIELDSDILEFFEKVEWKYLTVPYQSMFHLSVFRHSTLATDTLTYATSGLKVMSRIDLPLRRNHRVVLSLVKDIERVNPLALKRLKMFPKAAAKVLATIRVTKYKLEAVRRKADLTMFGSHLPNVGPSRDQIDAAHIGFNTVATSFIAATKRSHHPSNKV